MKRTFLLIGTLALLGGPVRADETTAGSPSVTLDSPSSSGGGRLGLGMMFGEPTGASVKYFFSDQFAIDGGAGWSFHRETDFQIHSDALWHVHDLFDSNEGQFSLYFGAGARVKFREHAEDRIGVRVPLGLSYKFDRTPVDVFVEVAPIIDFTPATKGSFSAALGARYWF